MTVQNVAIGKKSDFLSRQRAYHERAQTICQSCQTPYIFLFTSGFFSNVTLCAAFRCKNKGTHAFLIDAKRRKLWERALKRKNWTSTKWSKLCSDHFTSADYFCGSAYTGRLGRVRFSDKLDAPEIMAIMNESTRLNFRITNESEIITLLTDNVISIVQLDPQESIIGFLSLKDYPMQDAINPGHWEEFLWMTYKAINLNARNTLFIHMFCWNANYGRNLVDNILKSVFMHDAHLNYIAVIKPLEKYQLLSPDNASAEISFRRVQAVATNGACANMLPSLWIADREVVSPRLRIRRAVEEDNDDIVQILEKHSTRLKEMYGEFYISELVAHPGSRVLLVCEHKELTVGIMCLNTEINYEALEESFVLSPFAGLKHLKEPIEDQPLRKSFHVDSMTEILETTELNKPQKSRGSSTDRVCNFHINRLDSNKDPQDYGELLDFFQDDDIEFEIINIEEEVMKVPKLLSKDEIVMSYSSLRFRDFLEKLPESRDSFDEKSIFKDSFKSNDSYIPQIKHYNGKPNAFLLELFALHDELDERYGFDILEAAYEIFPDREYCVLSLPSNHPPFPLLEHFTLVTPLHNHHRFISEALYVAHINSIKGKLHVRSGQEHDMHYLYSVVEHSGRRQHLLDLFQTSLKINTRKIISYVLLSENQPVGVVILGPLVGWETLRAQFNISPYPKTLKTDGLILGAVVSPLFEPHYRWLLREVLRQSKYSTLFWTLCVVGKGDMSLKRNLMTMFNYMVPLYSCKPIPNITRVAYMDILSAKSSQPLAYCGIIRPITSLPKIDINHSIVVVGSSSTGLAFIEALVMGLPEWYLNFTNVTLVSEAGLPQSFDCLSAAVTCMPRYGRFTNSYMKKVPFTSHIDVITGVMVKINRKRKCIILKNDNLVFYDMLVLTCGLQFQHPNHFEESTKLLESKGQGVSCSHKQMDDPSYQPHRLSTSSELPQNVMIINDIQDANFCLKKLMALVKNSKDSASCLSTNKMIVVYGESLEVYTCMAALLELKIEPKYIAFVESYDDNQWPRVNCFNDEKIDERIQETIEALGIQVYRRYNIINWTLRRNYVKSINLLSTFRCIELNCFVLFFYGCKRIDENTFRALNESGLVYDGGLVVSADFKTNDPNIYGAGTCTRYSRCLYADKYMHKYYYSEDVGENLATQILKLLDPFTVMNDDIKNSQSVLPFYSSTLLQFLGSHMNLQKMISLPESSRTQDWASVLTFESPVYAYATLPGLLYYLKLRKPGPDIPMEVALSLPHQGHTLETENKGNFFKMKFSDSHVFEGATCLCKSKFLPEFYIKLFGKHERFFNNLFARYEMKLADDLNEFITQPWIAALYLFSFRLVLENTEIHKIQTVDRGSLRSVLNRFIGEEYIDKECGQSVEFRAKIKEYWQAIDGDSIVWHHLSAYLHRYALTNPQYQKPKPELTFMCHL